MFHLFSDQKLSAKLVLMQFFHSSVNNECRNKSCMCFNHATKINIKG